jgi:DNA modification methylase
MISKKLSSLDWGEEISFPSSRKGDLYSHVVGARYPCRSVAYVPRLILTELMQSTGISTLNVLDPFMGSGTTALEANLLALNAYGLEVDPYARLIGEASVMKFTQEELHGLNDFLNDIDRIYEKTQPVPALAPAISNIYHWFSENTVEDLTRLKKIIFDFTVDKIRYRNFLLAAFADIIRGVSFAERQSLKPYVSTRFEKVPGEVIPLFKKCLKKYIEGAFSVACITNYGNGKIQWIDGDATTFKLAPIIDVAITSPPYINAMDYVRCIRLESSWVDTGNSEVFSEVRAAQIGEAIRSKKTILSPLVKEIICADFENIAAIDKIRGNTLAAYFEDMKLNMTRVYEALKSGGSYHIIVGDSVVRGVAVPTHKYLAEIAKLIGFDWTSYFKYQIKDHRTSLPRNGRGGKIAFEHVITLRKP